MKSFQRQITTVVASSVYVEWLPRGFVIRFMFKLFVLCPSFERADSWLRDATVDATVKLVDIRVTKLLLFWWSLFRCVLVTQLVMSCLDVEGCTISGNGHGEDLIRISNVLIGHGKYKAIINLSPIYMSRSNYSRMWVLNEANGHRWDGEEKTFELFELQWKGHIQCNSGRPRCIPPCVFPHVSILNLHILFRPLSRARFYVLN